MSRERSTRERREDASGNDATESDTVERAPLTAEEQEEFRIHKFHVFSHRTSEDVDSKARDARDKPRSQLGFNNVSTVRTTRLQITGRTLYASKSLVPEVQEATFTGARSKAKSKTAQCVRMRISDLTLPDGVFTLGLHLRPGASRSGKLKEDPEGCIAAIDIDSTKSKEERHGRQVLLRKCLCTPHPHFFLWASTGEWNLSVREGQVEIPFYVGSNGLGRHGTNTLRAPPIVDEDQPTPEDDLAAAHLESSSDLFVPRQGIPVYSDGHFCFAAYYGDQNALNRFQDALISFNSGDNAAGAVQLFVRIVRRGFKKIYISGSIPLEQIQFLPQHGRLVLSQGSNNQSWISSNPFSLVSELSAGFSHTNESTQSPSTSNPYSYSADSPSDALSPAAEDTWFYGAARDELSDDSSHFSSSVTPDTPVPFIYEQDPSLYSVDDDIINMLQFWQEQKTTSLGIPMDVAPPDVFVNLRDSTQMDVDSTFPESDEGFVIPPSRPPHLFLPAPSSLNRREHRPVPESDALAVANSFFNDAPATPVGASATMAFAGKSVGPTPQSASASAPSSFSDLSAPAAPAFYAAAPPASPRAAMAPAPPAPAPAPMSAPPPPPPGMASADFLGPSASPAMANPYSAVPNAPLGPAPGSMPRPAFSGMQMQQQPPSRGAQAYPAPSAQASAPQMGLNPYGAPPASTAVSQMGPQAYPATPSMAYGAAPAPPSAKAPGGYGMAAPKRAPAGPPAAGGAAPKKVTMGAGGAPMNMPTAYLGSPSRPIAPVQAQQSAVISIKPDADLLMEMAIEASKQAPLHSALDRQRTSRRSSSQKLSDAPSDKMLIDFSSESVVAAPSPSVQKPLSQQQIQQLQKPAAGSGGGGFGGVTNATPVGFVKGASSISPRGANWSAASGRGGATTPVGSLSRSVSSSSSSSDVADGALAPSRNKIDQRNQSFSFSKLASSGDASPASSSVAKKSKKKDSAVDKEYKKEKDSSKRKSAVPAASIRSRVSSVKAEKLKRSSSDDEDEDNSSSDIGDDEDHDDMMMDVSAEEQKPSQPSSAKVATAQEKEMQADKKSARLEPEPEAKQERDQSTSRKKLQIPAPVIARDTHVKDEEESEEAPMMSMMSEDAARAEAEADAELNALLDSLSMEPKTVEALRIFVAESAQSQESAEKKEYLEALLGVSPKSAPLHSGMWGSSWSYKIYSFKNKKTESEKFYAFMSTSEKKFQTWRVVPTHSDAANFISSRYNAPVLKCNDGTMFRRHWRDLFPGLQQVSSWNPFIRVGQIQSLILGITSIAFDLVNSDSVHLDLKLESFAYSDQSLASGQVILSSPEAIRGRSTTQSPSFAKLLAPTLEKLYAHFSSELDLLKKSSGKAPPPSTLIWFPLSKVYDEIITLVSISTGAEDDPEEAKRATDLCHYLRARCMAMSPTSVFPSHDFDEIMQEFKSAGTVDVTKLFCNAHTKMRLSHSREPTATNRISDLLSEQLAMDHALMAHATLVSRRGSPAVAVLGSQDKVDFFNKSFSEFSLASMGHPDTEVYFEHVDVSSATDSVLEAPFLFLMSVNQIPEEVEQAKKLVARCAALSSFTFLSLLNFYVR
jgi:hypothetical protein